MKIRKRIGIVAHDNKKDDLLAWVKYNEATLSQHELYATGTTGKMLSESCLPDIHLLKSGPLGGDAQLSAMIVDSELDMLIFLWDPMTPQPHDADVKALLRMSVLYNIPTACNKSTADFIVSSNLFNNDYEPIMKDYSNYLAREIDSEYTR